MEIERALHFLKSTAAQYAKAKAECVYLTEFRKSKKAILIREAESKGIKTGQERESYAYSHNEYIQLLKGLKVATEESERLRLLVKSAGVQIDIWKTNQMREMSEARLR